MNTRYQVIEVFREERKARAGERLLDILGHLTCQELGREERLFGQCLAKARLFGLRQRLDFDLDGVGPRTRAMHLGGDDAMLDLDVQHLSSPRIRSPAREPRAEMKALEHRDPPLGPPVLPETALFRLRLDPARGRQWRGRLEVRKVLPGHL